MKCLFCGRTPQQILEQNGEFTLPVPEEYKFINPKDKNGVEYTTMFYNNFFICKTCESIKHHEKYEKHMKRKLCLNELQNIKNVALEQWNYNKCNLGLARVLEHIDKQINELNKCTEE